MIISKVAGAAGEPWYIVTAMTCLPSRGTTLLHWREQSGFCGARQLGGCSLTEQVKPDLQRLLDFYEVDTSRLSEVGWSRRKIRCLIHDDRNPSMSVNLEEGKVHCWSCPAHGDVYDIIMQREGKTFSEAKQWAADNLGFTSAPRERVGAGRAKPYKPSWLDDDD